ncbi:hypothetical protein HK098_002733 [Nowakowskiella sp. JEL0407]|nr:hypothetical protein HK098_002733 [Nowakowskiella sp. JEL0407]
MYQISFTEDAFPLAITKRTTRETPDFDLLQMELNIFRQKQTSVETADQPENQRPRPTAFQRMMLTLKKTLALSDRVKDGFAIFGGGMLSVLAFILFIGVIGLYIAGAGAAAAATGASVTKQDINQAAIAGAWISLINVASAIIIIIGAGCISPLTAIDGCGLILTVILILGIPTGIALLSSYFASLVLKLAFIPIAKAYLAAFFVNFVGSLLLSWLSIFGTGATGCAAGATFCAVYGINPAAGAAAGTVYGVLANPMSVMQWSCGGDPDYY